MRSTWTIYINIEYGESVVGENKYMMYYVFIQMQTYIFYICADR